MAMKMMKLSKEKKDQFDIWNEIQPYLGMFFFKGRKGNSVDICGLILFGDVFPKIEGS